MNKKAALSMMTKVIIGLVIAVPLLLGMFGTGQRAYSLMFGSSSSQSIDYLFNRFVEYYKNCKEIETTGCSCGGFNYALSRYYKIKLEQRGEKTAIILFFKNEMVGKEILIEDNVLCVYFPLAKPEKKVENRDKLEIESRDKYPVEATSYTYDGNIFLMKYDEKHTCFPVVALPAYYNEFVKIESCETKILREELIGGFLGSKIVVEYLGNDDKAKLIARQIRRATSSRGNQKIEYIIMHHTATPTLKRTLEVLGERDRSVHYVVGRDGTVVYTVGESRSAWHGGCAKDIDPGCLLDFDMNPKSIGIEIVNCGRGVGDSCGQRGAPEAVDPYPLVQREAVDKLVRYLIEKYKIPENNILGHGCVTKNKMAKEPAGFEPPEEVDWSIKRYGEHADLCPAS